MSRPLSRRPRGPEASLLALALALLAAAASGARAQARPVDPDEATDLRVAKSAPGRVSLTWQAPRTTPDSYQVRRCVIPSLHVPYYGNCVAEGLSTPAHDEATPAGNVFYLVTGQFGGVEGPLGWSFDGTTWPGRTAPACSDPALPAPMSVEIAFDGDETVCGTNVTVTYPAAAATFSLAACIGVTNGFFPATNGTVPGVVRHACVSAGGATSPGLITRLDFDVGPCPLTVDAFDVTTCSVTVGRPTCSTPETIVVPCRIQ